MRPADQAIQEVVSELGELGHGRVSQNPSHLECHGRDEGWRPVCAPQAVFYPQSTAEVVAGVRACADRAIPVIPFGAGTSIEGQIMASFGGVTFDMSRMDSLLTVHTEDFYCRVQPGITRGALNTALRDTGLFFPIDPGADATIGGMASTRASGTNAVRYGTMRDAVMGLEVVLATGEVIRTGARTRKSAAGLDLTALFVGAEGTLGVITELTIRLHALPEAFSTAVATFPDLRSAVETVAAIMQSGMSVGRIEFLDELYAQALSRFEGLQLHEAPLLLIEFSGMRGFVSLEAAAAAELARDHGALQINYTSDPEERSRLWRARHRAYWAGLKLRPGSRAIVTDVCVPMSLLVESVVAAQEDFRHHELIAPILGHVGDGNFHATILVDPADSQQIERAEAAHERLVLRALQIGGTCTGEHGIGLGKRRYLEIEHGTAVDSMRAIKQALDPRGIFNPGKMFS